MQKDGQSESEREHDEGGGTTYQSGQSSGGVFFATAFQSAIRGARITKKCISQSVCFIQTKCFCNALDVIRVPRVPKNVKKCQEHPKVPKMARKCPELPNLKNSIMKFFVTRCILIIFRI